jgi:hypothetical protein
MLVGAPLQESNLLWARGLLGHDGESVLWSSLRAWGVVQEPDFVVKAQPLAAFLSHLCDPLPGDELRQR